MGTRADAANPSPRTFPGFDETGEVLPGLGPLTRIDRHPSLWAWAIQCLRRRRSLSIALAALDRTVLGERADAIVSFMDPLAALHRRVGSSRIALLSIGHPLRMTHPDHPIDAVHAASARMISGRARWSSFGGLRYSLSFEPLRPLAEQGLLVGPPLVEGAASPTPAQTTDGGWVVQLARADQRPEVELWHQRHPEIPIDCFYDRSRSVGTEEVDGNLRFHPLDRDHLRQRMAVSRGIIVDAGFEALAHAASFGKPVVHWLGRPHPETLLLARDLERLGLAKASRSFHPTIDGPSIPPGGERFREWLSRSDACLDTAFRALASHAR